MTALLKRLLAIVFYWRRREEPPPPAVIEPPPQEPPAPAKVRQRPRRPRLDMRLKTAILDHLDDNTKIIGRMKAHFPSEYGLYSQMGAVIVPHENPFLHWLRLYKEPVSPWFNQARPGFGAVVTGDPHDATAGKDEPLSARLTHFLKIKHPTDMRRRMFQRDHQIIQPIAPDSDLYIFTLYYDQRDWALLFPKKSRKEWRMCKFFERAFAVELPIEITKDGEARPLKIKRDKYHNKIRLHTKHWDYPYSKEYMKELKWKQTPTPEQFILAEVGMTLRCYEEATASMIQVRASKNGICTLVNVDVEQTPDFFNDREDVIVDGIKKRIFHIVRPHERELGNKTALVRLHFRGLREFVWNGYEIKISVPGRDHYDFAKDWDVAAIEPANDEEYRTGIDLGEVGAWMVANQNSRAGAMVGKAGPLIPLRDFGEPPAAP